MNCSIVANSESLIAKCNIVISLYTQQKKNIFTDEELQLTYIHSYKRSYF